MPSPRKKKNDNEPQEKPNVDTRQWYWSARPGNSTDTNGTFQCLSCCKSQRHPTPSRNAAAHIPPWCEKLPSQDFVIFLEPMTDLICQYNLYYNAFLPETLEGIQRVPEELLPYLNRHTFMIDDIRWSRWVEAISRYTPLSWEDVPCFQGATSPFSPATQHATWDI